ncbi:hypothetical protein BGZ46_007277 [Entomortierella lignicola]|nr:hypothetical protein BGZ46_007277 [Entomortierella lignicola]
MDIEVIQLPVISGKTSHPSVDYGIFMYIGCTLSPFTAVMWHFTEAVKVCSVDNKDRHCNVRLKQNYNADMLGLKARDWMMSEEFKTMLDTKKVIVKVDDDTIISKDVLEGLVNEFAASDYKYAGNMRRAENQIIWSNGPLFMVKSDYMRQQLRDNFRTLDYYKKEEDVQMGDLLGITNFKDVCNIDVDVFRHRFYEDKRMEIRFKPYISC